MNKELNKAFALLRCYESDDLLEYSVYINELGTIENLIEKQQKEIEELKSRKYVINAETQEIKEIPIDNNYINKDKIRDKIKELEDNKKIQLLNKPSVVKQICLSTFRELLEENNDE